MEKHKRRPVAGAKEARASSANFDGFFFTTRHLEFSSKMLLVYSIRHSRGNGNPGSFLEFKKSNLDARVREHDVR